ncbi:MAG: O-antigen ligase family protein, partial [Bacteroidetes bacterium]|nr:O-antigen ligase family protein [Bacteroidota bacterium]
MADAIHMTPSGPSDRWLGAWGTFLIRGAFGFALFVLLYLTWAAPEILPFLPIVMLGGAGLVFLFQRPLLNLGVVMCGFATIVGFKAGLQAEEALYGLYYLFFLAYWFFTRSILNGETVCRTREERVLLMFLVFVTLTVPVSFLFEVYPGDLMGEWLSLTMLGFYWPIREAVEKHPKGLRVVIGSVMFVGLFVLARNLLEYRSDLANAEALWQIATSRAIANESLLMVPALFSIVLFLRTKSWWGRAFFLTMVLGLFAGLILTQSRAYWVAFFLGAGVTFLFVPMKDRVRMLTVGILSATGVFALAWFVLGDYLLLVLTGLLDRFLTLETAVTKDISLINRFLEAKGVWKHIQVNPILGHGMGVPYRFFNITYMYSEVKTFVHNGYVALWFKFGIWGLGMMLFLMIRFWMISFGTWWKKLAAPVPAIVSLAITG